MKKGMILVLTLTTMFLTACGGDDSKKSFENRGRTGTTSGTNAGVGTFGVNGLSYRACDGGSIFVQPGYENSHYAAIEDMLSADADPAYFDLGEIDGTCGSDRFVAINGLIDTYDGFDRNGDNDSDITGESWLDLAIIDETALANDDLPPISIKGDRGAYGWVSGNQFYVEFTWGFEDDAGYIVMGGTVDYQRQIVYGVVEYENTKENNNIGTLGEFEIPLCDLFKCN